jgi:hypothetical protein
MSFQVRGRRPENLETKQNHHMRICLRLDSTLRTGPPSPPLSIDHEQRLLQVRLTLCRYVSTGQQKQENTVGSWTTSEKPVRPCTRKSCISSSPNREQVKCESLDHKNSEDKVTRIATCHDISTICSTKFLPCTSPLALSNPTAQDYGA